jgi:N-acetylmuramoyl-L-alanine amidase
VSHQKPKNDSLRQLYQQKLNTYLLKNQSKSDYIQISDTAITLYKDDSEQKIIDISLDWAMVKKLKNSFLANPQKTYKQLIDSDLATILNHTPDTIATTSLPQKSQLKPLQGWRIALDPGHFAGNMKTAKVEGKFIDIKVGEKQISFFESEWAWYTARILQKKLEATGAQVILTRNKFQHTALDDTYENWYQNYRQSLLDSGKSTSELSPYKAFVSKFFRMELAERAKKINDFKPHLTLIMHYNVEANNTGWQKPVETNYSMVFVGGSFQEKELAQTEQRFHLLRLLLTEDLAQSIRFSEKILTKIQKGLGVKPIPAKNNQAFLAENSLLTEKTGVYSRNLTLTREVAGVLAYIEPLFQDNIHEIKRLGKRDTAFEGQKIPYRLFQVAEAYYEAVLEFVEETKN